jgi:hypothetical protein
VAGPPNKDWPVGVEAAGVVPADLKVEAPKGFLLALAALGEAPRPLKNPPPPEAAAAPLPPKRLVETGAPDDPLEQTPPEPSNVVEAVPKAEAEVVWVPPNGDEAAFVLPPKAGFAATPKTEEEAATEVAVGVPPNTKAGEGLAPNTEAEVVEANGVAVFAAVAAAAAAVPPNTEADAVEAVPKTDPEVVEEAVVVAALPPKIDDPVVGVPVPPPKTDPEPSVDVSKIIVIDYR